MKQRIGDVRIGISGWTYKPWRGVFYPKGLPQRQELSFAANSFRSIEINGTFYGLQRPESFAAWHAATPDDFIFAIKGPRFITHMKRLIDVETPLANFLASGVLRLEQKLGPILWQFPPQMKFDPARFETFLQLLPRDTEQALQLASQHDARLNGRSHLEIDRQRPMRHAFEIRHDSFRSQAFIDLLRQYHVGLVVADTVDWPLLMDITADFIYCRLHGSEQLYVSGYDDAALDHWAQLIGEWRRGKDPQSAPRVGPPSPPQMRGLDVYVYFDNDAKVRAPFDAAALAAKLGEIAEPQVERA
ncbi:DUF72 domain-containing protein [Neorhizobium sp. SOG26]|uniref:DUF72 domain-containing protein n=1 Tax=Neorhizobium turbinariae TaxID=2937795 RepID=A0ABT0IWU4_9HYPH|nr:MULTISPECIES: DUF72 domain-containing protein [Neorhizobium]AXV15504.1 DUF72 domain-containing protein [Neorhizobium sp. SOG26]MCK8782357.1 DUF72 domain-containing protein [Neorhizobium turbinariae]